MEKKKENKGLEEEYLETLSCDFEEPQIDEKEIDEIVYQMKNGITKLKKMSRQEVLEKFANRDDDEIDYKTDDED